MIPLLAGGMTGGIGAVGFVLRMVLGIAGALALGLGVSCMGGDSGSGDAAERELSMVRAAERESRDAEERIREALGAAREEAAEAAEDWDAERAGYDERLAEIAAMQAEATRLRAGLAESDADRAQLREALLDPEPGICRPGCTLPEELRDTVEGRQ